jgi:intracellular sulfur oxidation DsrE/DsrF family protein
MDRRSILSSVFRLACLTPPITAIGMRTASATEASKVVYHLSELERVDFVLGNIRNHYDGMGGPANVTIALAVHGPALKAFHAAGVNPDVSKRIDDFVKSGLRPSACINTMHAQNVTLKDLLPGFTVADKGAVVRLTELQAQGYAYLRP